MKTPEARIGALERHLKALGLEHCRCSPNSCDVQVVDGASPPSPPQPCWRCGRPRLVQIEVLDPYAEVAT